MKFLCLVVSVSVHAIVLTCILPTAMLPSVSYAAALPPATTSITSSGLNTHVSAPTTLPSGKVNFDITGGTRPNNGPNLFHSFGQFSIATNHIANFLNDTGLPTSNIIGRINGGQVSNIWGTIQTTGFGAANLYLINPAGFLFGPTASLNVGGSFTATTADYLKMSDGAKFYADPVQPSVLSVANVAAFGFTNPQPVAISVEGTTLQVASGQGLTMVGGDFNMTGGMLSAPSGQINIVSVGAPASPTATAGGEVSLSASGALPALTPIGFTGLGNVSLSDNATITAAGTTAGSVSIQGGQLTFENGIAITSDVAPPPASGAVTISGTGVHITGTGMDITGSDVSIAGATLAAHNIDVNGQPTAGGAITITAGGTGGTGTVTVAQGATLDVSGDPGGTVTVRGNNLTVDHSFVTADTLGNQNGAAVAVDINVAGAVVAKNSSVIEAVTVGGGSGGDIVIQGSSLNVNTSSVIVTDTQGSGRAGNVQIQAPSLTVSQGGQIIAETEGSGDGGNIVINSSTVGVSGSGQIFTDTLGSGHGGNVQIQAQNLTLNTNGLIAVTTEGPGDAGTLVIAADSVTLVNGSSPFFLTALEADALPGSSGRGADMQLTAHTLQLQHGAQIFVANQGSGKGGNIDIQADQIVFTGSTATSGPRLLSGIEAEMLGPGDGANVHITANSLQLTAGAEVSTGPFNNSATGNAGSINIVANDILISGLSGTLPSQLSSGTVTRGRGGNITINTGTLTVTNDGRISLTTSSSGSGGTLDVTAQQIVLDGGPSPRFGVIVSSATSSSGPAGAIRIHTGTLDVKDGAVIKTSGGTGDGGPIEITADSILISATNNVTRPTGLFANTTGVGRGGSITIKTGTLELDNGATLNTSVSTSSIPVGFPVNAKGGTIDVTADSVIIGGRNSAGQSAGISADSTTTVVAANAGDIHLAAQNVSLKDGGFLSTTTKGQGNGGNIVVTAENTALSNGANITATTVGSGNAGSVTVQTGELSLTYGSQITSSTSGAGHGGTITVQGMAGAGNSADMVTIMGSNSSTGQASGLFTTTSGTGAGGNILLNANTIALQDGGTLSAATSSSSPTATGGSITIDAGQMTMTNGALVTAASLQQLNPGAPSVANPAGNAGNISVTASNLSMDGIGTKITAATEGSGLGGNILVNTNALSLTGGAEITSSTTGAGQGGSVTVTASDSLSLTGTSTIANLARSSGNAGQVTLTTPSLIMNNGYVLASTSATSNGGNAGSITVNVHDATLTDGSQINANTSGSGHGGSITVQGLAGGGSSANLLDVHSSTQSTFISTSTIGTGDAGTLDIHADTVRLQGGGGSFVGLASQVSTGASGPANAGNLTVNAHTLEVRDGAQISASVFAGSGRGGTVNVTADSILISGADANGNPAGVFSSLIYPATGNAGDIHVVSRDLTLTNFGQINAFSGSFGNAGNIDIRTGNLTATNGAFISSANFGAGAGGNVSVTADQILLQGPTNPPQAFTTPGIFSIGGVSSTRAGDITIQTGSLTILDGAQITARTNGPGRGGTIDITADQVTISGQDSNLFMPEGKASGIYAGTRILDPTVPVFVQLATGNAGNINLTTGSLNLQNGGRLEALSASAGNGGNISVNSGTLSLSGGASISAETQSTGNAGSINLQLTNNLSLAGGSSISASTSGAGTGGSITVTTPALDLTGAALITAQTSGTGNAGSITLNTNQLSVMSGGQIVSDSTGTQKGAGSAGSITVQGLQGAGSSAASLLLSGANSAISTNTAGPGQGGNIQIAASQTQVEQIATITAGTSGSGNAGNITLTGESLNVTSGGRIQASTSGAGNAGTITLTTSKDISIAGLSPDGQTRSGIFAKTLAPGTGGGNPGTGGGSGGGSGSGQGSSGGGGQGSGAIAGNAGDIVMTARNVSLTGSAQIDSSTTTSGAGGKVSITATDTVTVAGTNTLLSTNSQQGTGKGGNIQVVAREVNVQDGGSISAQTSTSGNAGSIDLTVRDTLSITNGGTITTSTSGDGNGGSITITADQVVMNGPGSSITADTLHPFADLSVTLSLLHKPDSDLTVQLNSPDGTRVALFSQVGGNGSNFTNTTLSDSSTTPITSGNAPFTGTFRPREPLDQLVGQPASGTWTLNIRDLSQGNGTAGSLQSWSLALGPGSQLFTASGLPKNINDGGSIQSSLNVNLGSQLINGTGEAKGQGGDITVNARTVTLENGATMSATSRGLGKGGILTINTTGPLTLTGANSGLFSNAEATGAGGNINVQAAGMSLADGATISAASSGKGDAGSIAINAGSQFLSTNGSVTTESLNASGGNITLLATDMVHLINSQINTSVAGGPTTVGGNILIDPQFVILQNSQIVAQAFQGQGGNINIVANTFLPDASSVVSASSQFGLSGTVNITSPIQNLSGTLVPLKQSYLSGTVLSNQRCAARLAEGQVSTFIVTEQDGLPQEPGGLLSSLSTEHDGGVSLESVKQVLVASVRPSFFTPLSYEQRVWTDESCRR